MRLAQLVGTGLEGETGFPSERVGERGDLEDGLTVSMMTEKTFLGSWLRPSATPS